MEPDLEMQVIPNETTTLSALKILPSEYCDDINTDASVVSSKYPVSKKFGLCSGKCSLSLIRTVPGVLGSSQDFYTIMDPNTARYIEHTYIVNVRNKIARANRY